MNMAMVNVLQIANNRQISALARDRPAPSFPDDRPAFDLFISRSPINIVNDLLKKSDPTIDKAVEMDPEKRKDVIKVIDPAIIRHIKALTADRTVVSVNTPPTGLAAS